MRYEVWSVPLAGARLMPEARTFPKRAMRRGWMLVLRAALALGLVVLVTIAVRRIDWRLLGEVFRSTRLPLLAAAALANLLQVACKSERWRLLLRPVRRISPALLYLYLGVSFCASSILPMGAGEGLRVYLLRRRHRIAIAVSTAVLVSEKLFDGIGLIFILLALPFLLALPPWLSPLIVAVSAGGVAVSITAIALTGRASRSAWTGRWARLAPLAPTVEGIGKPSMFVGATSWSLAAHLIDCVAIDLVLTSVGLDLPWAAGGLVLCVFSFTLLIPLMPGHFGTLEAGAVGALQLLGAPIEKAVAFALVLHATQIASMIPFGLAGLGLLREARAEMASESTA